MSVILIKCFIGREDKILDFGYDVIMYSKADKKRAIELYYQYHHSWSAVVRELGYPSLGALKRWVKDYEQDAKATLDDTPRKRKSKYSGAQRQAAVDHFFEHGQFITKTVKTLGYPSRQLLREWLLEDPRCDDTLRSRTVVTKPAATEEVKAKAVEALYKREAPVREIAEDFGVSRETLYGWKREVLGETFPAKQAPGLLEGSAEEKVTPEVSSLQARIKELELQNDILLQVNALLKKDLGIDHLNLTNREKVQVIDALRDKHSLNTLLKALQLLKSSYFYQRGAIAKGDKYEAIRPRLKVIFKQNYESYGYRRIKMELDDEGIHLSEKVIRRLMAEEGLEVTITRCRKYSSYAGEITPAVPNILDRDFQAETPNQKLVTDITEFSIQAGKVYLSPLIDCFDGQITSWTIGTSPNAELVNTMLSAAAETLALDEKKPVVHSDRGAHYRWPGWIELMDEFGFTRSMSKKASTPDNAQAESFFGHLKTEFFYNRSWLGKSIDDFTKELNQYIEWYNTKRRKKVLGGKSPQEYRQNMVA